MTELQNLVTFDREKIDLIKRMVARDATDDELKVFLHQAQRMGLDPLAKQIYFRKSSYKGKDQMTIITGIDGYRLVADRTGKYAGNDDPVFDNEESPNRATVTVYKMVGGVRCGYSATARWHQYCPSPPQDFMWKKMPHLMLGKCAEGLALRKAFPAELSGAYIEEEMQQAIPVAVVAADEPSKGDSVKTEGGYNAQNRAHQTWLISQLKKKGITDDRWDDIGTRLQGRPSAELDSVLGAMGLA